MAARMVGRTRKVGAVHSRKQDGCHSSLSAFGLSGLLSPERATVPTVSKDELIRWRSADGFAARWKTDRLDSGGYWRSKVGRNRHIFVT